MTHSGVSGNIRVTDILLEKRVYVRGIGDSVWSLLCEKYSSPATYCVWVYVGDYGCIGVTGLLGSF